MLGRVQIGRYRVLRCLPTRKRGQRSPLSHGVYRNMGGLITPILWGFCSHMSCVSWRILVLSEIFLAKSFPMAPFPMAPLSIARNIVSVGHFHQVILRKEQKYESPLTHLMRKDETSSAHTQPGAHTLDRCCDSETTVARRRCRKCAHTD